MDKEMNIIEAYLKEYKQMIIMLIGMPTSNKSNIAKELESDIDLNFTLININDYIEKNLLILKLKILILNYMIILIILIILN